MSASVQAVRGMKDLLPEEAVLWQRLHDVSRDAFTRYAYRQIALPIVERTELFKRAVGEVTDIVEKEMYTFDDRNGDSLSLRPEGTAGAVRAAIEHGWTSGQTERLWYAGPMFRHERPQKGRYRQFHQIGVEVFGADGPDIDAEIILLGERIWRELGLSGITLQLNSLGSAEARQAYREKLTEYLRAHDELLDDDSRRRLEHNPLRVLDSKNPALADLIAGAPSLSDHLDDESCRHFDRLCDLLQRAGVKVQLNSRLVRGLDYYSRTVFEWTTTELGAQDAVCSGGRYDGLVPMLGGKPTSATGWAMGVERIVALMAGQQVAVNPGQPQVFMVAVGEACEAEAMLLAERLRNETSLAVQCNAGGGSFKAQFRRADKSGAGFAVVLGESELVEGKAQIKPLRGAGDQETVAVADLPGRLTELLGQ